MALEGKNSILFPYPIQMIIFVMFFEIITVFHIIYQFLYNMAWFLARVKNEALYLQ